MSSVFFNLEKRSRSFSKSSAVSLADRTPSMTRRANASFEIEPSKVDGSAVFATSSFCDAFSFWPCFWPPTSYYSKFSGFGDLVGIQQKTTNAVIERRLTEAGVVAMSGKVKSDSMEEQFYTVAEAAKILKVSRDTITTLFADEPGVVDLGSPERLHKRRYRVLRIPHAVFNRVIHKLRVQ
jgi:hypothetical protein